MISVQQSDQLNRIARRLDVIRLAVRAAGNEGIEEALLDVIDEIRALDGAR